VIKTPAWKEALEKNQWDEDYMPSAELAKHLKSQYNILKDVLSDLGMIKP
jgi:tripartite-type tricarboxylate transporter receptor subunit TctC